MLRSLLIVAALCFVSVARGQETTYPESIVQILKKGDRIGIFRNRDTRTAYVTAYTHQVFDAIIDSKKLTIDELDAKYPFVAEARQRALAEQLEKKAQKEKLSGEEADWRPIVRVIQRNTEQLGVVVHVGADYFVFESANDASRQALPVHRIELISWSDEVPLAIAFGGTIDR